MPDLKDGESVEMKGSGAKPYVLKNTGGVYSCTCPAWRNQSLAIERRTCKHLRKLRGEEAEEARVGAAAAAKRVRKSEDGEEEAGPPLLLAETWDNAADLAGWWMSEKLDGVRAYWDGKQFLSRLGNQYHAPDWFVEGLPETPLDGELWLDRKKFQRTVSIVRRQDKSDHWKDIRFLVFDAPASSDSFEDRLRFLADTFARKSTPFAAMHEHNQCSGLEHLCSELTRIEALGGEGLMLRQPGSKYEVGRSATLLKVKTFHDAEAVVLEHLAGKGRHQGRLGALQVRLKDGTEFAVGTGFSDAERAAPPPVDSVITFRYQELSEAGVPRFLSYVGLRHESPEKLNMATKSPTVKESQDQPKSKVSSAKAPGPESQQSGGARYFEYIGGTSRKFWEIRHSGCEVTVRFGRIGSAGQSKVKSFPEESAAAKHVEKLIGEKTGEGYIESGLER
jgi:DNA ligase-1